MPYTMYTKAQEISPARGAGRTALLPGTTSFAAHMGTVISSFTGAPAGAGVLVAAGVGVGVAAGVAVGVAMGVGVAVGVAMGVGVAAGVADGDAKGV